ncbi:MAG TPA: MlaD family protein [Chthoniobacterales bacterium]|jgi:ABC-type transporter Mla subunit MlaD|nr:MlaD family protein [Chthoniobacterales bacterium]
MKRNLSDYIVALAVIACSLVLLGALTIALSGYRLKKPERTLQINYEDVTGIKVHSEVRYAGAPAGRVIAMRHLSAAERSASENKKDTIRVTISLDEGIPPLPSDVMATLSSDTMLSPKFVALSAGTPGGKTLANNAAIEGHPAYGLDQIMAAAGPLFENANKLLDNLNVTVTDLKGNLGQFMPKISPLVDTLNTDLDELHKVVTDLGGVEKNANTVLGTADKFLGTTDQQLQEQMKELHVILLNLKVVSTHAKAITEALGEKPNRLIFSGKANKLTPEAEILKSSKPLPAKKP